MPCHLPGLKHGVIAHRLPCLHIVSTYECRVVVRLSLAVEEDDRYALLSRPLDGLCDGHRLTRSHHQQVDAAFRQTVYLPYLQLCVIVRLDNLHFHIGIIEVLCGLHLTVHLVSPLAFRALGHANPIDLAAFSACDQHGGQQQKHCYENLLDSLHRLLF